MVSTSVWLVLLTASIGTLLVMTLLGILLSKHIGDFKTTMAYYAMSITLTGFGMWYHNPYGVDNLIGILYELGAIMFIPYGLILLLLVEVHERTKERYEQHEESTPAG